MPHAIRIHRTGGPEVLAFEPIELNAPGPGEVRLRHTFVGVAFGRRAVPSRGPRRTSVALFFTRWITHFCAPVFMFYAGISAYLWASRGRSRAELSRYLLTRGLWLIFLELTVVRFGFFFNFDYSLVILLVFWALGWGMIALAGLVYLPSRVLAILSVAVIVLHNAFDGVKGGTVWKILHQVAPFRAAGHTFIPSYSLIPWVFVMAAGYCLGPVFRLDSQTRRKVLLRLGAAMTLAFFVIRASNLYGDPSRWSFQSSPFSPCSLSSTAPSTRRRFCFC